jgi:hypothetical protein
MTRIATRIAAIAFVLGVTISIQAYARDRDTSGAMTRMLACEGEDAKMEVYLPDSVRGMRVTPEAQALARPVIGYYTLDLTEENKGKSLEPVKVSMTADGKTVIINQYTRGLPVTRVPVGGGTVDFDQRFGTKAKCGPFQSADPNYR